MEEGDPRLTPSDGKTCQKPDCSRSADETYSGKNGNSVSVCSRHYWELVTGQELFDGGTYSPIPDSIGRDPILDSGSDIEIKPSRPPGGTWFLEVDLP